jgi:hypothetical protein
LNKRCARFPRPAKPAAARQTLERYRTRTAAPDASTIRGKIMGKYFIAWLLGVPAFVLLLFWMFF